MLAPLGWGLCFLAGWTLPDVAHAAGTFDVPAECGTRAEFDEQVTRLRGAQDELSAADVYIVQDGGEYVLRVVVAGSERQLRSADCRELFRSAPVIVVATLSAVAAQPPSEAPPLAPVASGSVTPADGVPSPTEAPQPLLLPPVATAAPPAKQQALQPAAKPRPEQVRGEMNSNSPQPLPLNSPRESDSAQRWLWLGAGVGMNFGGVPDLRPMPDLSLRWVGSTWGAVLGASYLPGARASAEGRTVLVTAASVRAGVLLQWDLLRILTGLQVSRYLGAGRSVPGRATDTAWDPQAALELGINFWDLQWFRLELGARASVSFLRPQFVVAGFGELYRVPPVSGAVMLSGFLSL